MEFNDRRAKTKFHIITPSDTVHSSHGTYQGAISALQPLAPSGHWLADNAEASLTVPGFNTQHHTTCDYCNKPATHISRDSGEPLCSSCGKDQYDHPRESLSKLTPRTVKMYGRGNPSSHLFEG